MSDRSGHVCGEVNGRGRDGTYAGYRRFIYDKSARTTALDEGPAEPSRPSAAVDRGCGKPAAYQSVDERFACAQTQAAKGVPERQGFEEAWDKVCA